MKVKKEEIKAMILQFPVEEIYAILIDDISHYGKKEIQTIIG